MDEKDDANDVSALGYIVVPAVVFLLFIPAVMAVAKNGAGARSMSEGRSSDLDEKFGSFDELQGEVDRLLGKYVAALESEQCKERIVCELGVKASGLPSQ